jgi:type I restriction-modification system DNA methylase subunit
MMSQSDDLEILKRSLTNYAETSVRMGMQAEDCLLWGFATVLAIQANDNVKAAWNDCQSEAVIRLTMIFLDDLDQQGYHISGLKQLQPPRLTPHMLSHVADIATSKTFSKEELNYTLDWIVEQFRLDMQGCITPKEVVSVMVSLLFEAKKPINGSKVLDPAMGSGAFLQEIQAVSEGVEFLGIEKNEKNVCLTSLYSYLNNYDDTIIKLGGAFYHLHNEKQFFDYVVSNPPVYRIPKPQAQHQFFEALQHRQVSSEMSLNFVQLGLQKLSSNGRAAFLVHMGTLFSTTEIKIREEWVKKEIIRAVISLPDKLLPHTSNKCAILIFSKEPNQTGGVSFVKADDLFESTYKGKNVLGEDAIKHIKSRLELTEVTYNRASVSTEVIASQNHSLYPDHYVLKEIDDVAEKISKQWVPIGELASVIQGTRGFGILPCGENEIIVGESIRQLRESNPFFEKKDLTSFNKKIVTTAPYDLLVKRLGAKPAIHMVSPDQADMVVDQTVFVLRFHEINPSLTHFIAEFLNSDRGKNHISSFCHNVTVQTLTKTILQKITIPVVGVAMQSLMMEISEAEISLKKETVKAEALKAQIFEGLGYEKIENDFDDIRFSLNTLETALKNKDKISYKVSNQYPYPLAYAYRNMYADREWSATYENQMKFGELVLSFMVSVGLGLLTHHQKDYQLNMTDLSIDLLDALKGGISPGHWQKLLHSICLLLRNIPSCPLSKQLSACWFSGRGKKLSDFGRQTMPEFICKLNDKKHWRGPSGSHASKAAVEAYRQNIDKALLDIEFFSGWDFFINDKLDYVSNASMFTCSVTVLRGDHPCFEQTDILSDTPLSVGDIYCKIDECVISMSPFLASLFNSNTQRTEIFSLDKKNKNGTYMMKSFDSGQSIQTNDDLTAKIDLWFSSAFTGQATQIKVIDTQK